MDVHLAGLALEALREHSVEQRAAVVAERWPHVRVHFEPAFGQLSNRKQVSKSVNKESATRTVGTEVEVEIGKKRTCEER